MKKRQTERITRLALATLFFTLLEGLYRAARLMFKWFLIAVIITVKLTVFAMMLPFSIYKCAARAISHRSFAASGQLAKWIWIDYWTTTRI